MRNLLSFVVVSFALLLPTVSRAGISLGARVGLAFPGGDVVRGLPLGSYSAFAVPLQIDAGYRFEKLGLGAYFRLGPSRLDGSFRDACAARNVGCQATTVAVGAQADVRLGSTNAGPWAGGFLGIENLQLTTPSGDATFTGFGLGAQGGYDLAFGDVTVGPYGAIVVGQFRTLESSQMVGTQAEGSIRSKSLHYWFHLGIRAAFTF